MLSVITIPLEAVIVVLLCIYLMIIFVIGDLGYPSCVLRALVLFYEHAATLRPRSMIRESGLP